MNRLTDQPTLEIEHDIPVLYVKSVSFPEGLLPAYQQLEEKLGNVNGRTFYGLSRMDGNGGIAYWAAAGEQTPGEGTQLGLPTMNIEKGTYLTKAITNWRGSEHLIGQAFQELMAACNPKPGGYCVEWYQGDDKVICMVPCG